MLSPPIRSNGMKSKRCAGDTELCALIVPQTILYPDSLGLRAEFLIPASPNRFTNILLLFLCVFLLVLSSHLFLLGLTVLWSGESVCSSCVSWTSSRSDYFSVVLTSPRKQYTGNWLIEFRNYLNIEMGPSTHDVWFLPTHPWGLRPQSCNGVLCQLPLRLPSVAEGVKFPGSGLGMFDGADAAYWHILL